MLTLLPAYLSLAKMTLLELLRRIVRGKEVEPIDVEHKVPHLGAYSDKPPDHPLP